MGAGRDRLARFTKCLAKRNFDCWHVRVHCRGHCAGYDFNCQFSTPVAGSRARRAIAADCQHA